MKRYIFTFLILLAGCFKANSNGYISREEFGLGTFITITIEKSPYSETILNHAFDLIKKLEKKFSVFIPENEVSKLNKEKKIKASRELKDVVEKSIYISRKTGGAFDITVLPLIKLYREAEKKGIPPSQKEIEDVLKYTGYQKIKVKGNTIQIPDKTEIDTGGISKGYIVDRVVKYLKGQGIHSGLVNAGGDIYCFGKNPEGGKWRIGVRDPFNKNRILKTIYISEAGIATSGDYERYVYIKGKKYGHIINPLTGKTVQDFPVSVTVIAPDTTTADGFATAFFVLGVGKSLKIAEEMNLGVFIVDGNGKIYESTKFSQFTIP